ncbi:MAG: hypothetical protein UW10_C0027G0013 [Candidatus Magasanikbacteria bacterium GW2011_GWA2_43_9]|nr:MAG: hypothetical protein UW10_C0027G0013 [Candidatus Magasanikbacteria bacterium GW2011_GWA2_43_9]
MHHLEAIDEDVEGFGGEQCTTHAITADLVVDLANPLVEGLGRRTRHWWCLLPDAVTHLSRLDVQQNSVIASLFEVPLIRFRVLRLDLRLGAIVVGAVRAAEHEARVAQLGGADEPCTWCVLRW